MLCNDYTWWISWSGRGCRWKQLWRNTDPAKLCETNAAEMSSSASTWVTGASPMQSLYCLVCHHSKHLYGLYVPFPSCVSGANQPPERSTLGSRAATLGWGGRRAKGSQCETSSLHVSMFSSSSSSSGPPSDSADLLRTPLAVTKGHPNILAWKSRRHILPVQSSHDTSQMANRTRKDHGIESACHVMNGEYNECNGNAVDLHGEWHRCVLQFELQMRWSSNLPVVKPRTRNHSREMSTPQETAGVLLLKSSGALLCRQSACPRESRRWWRLCARQEEPGRVGHGDCLTMPAKLASSGPMTSGLCASQTPWPRPPPRPPPRPATDGMEDPAGPLEPSTRMTSGHIKWHQKGCRCTFLPDRVNKSGSSR